MTTKHKPVGYWCLSCHSMVNKEHSFFIDETDERVLPSEVAKIEVVPVYTSTQIHHQMTKCKHRWSFVYSNQGAGGEWYVTFTCPNCAKSKQVVVPGKDQFSDSA